MSVKTVVRSARTVAFVLLGGSMICCASSSSSPGATTEGGATTAAGASGVGGFAALAASGGNDAHGIANGTGGLASPLGGASSAGGSVGSAGRNADTGGGLAGSAPGGSSANVEGGKGGASAGALNQSGGASASGGGGGGGTHDGSHGGSAGGSGAADDFLAAQALDGFAILKPCVSSFKPSGNAKNAGDCCCEELAANENQHISKQFGGDPSVTYDVQLRISGVAERYWYSGGMLDMGNQIFYTGGLPTIHSGQAPNRDLRAGQGACKIHPPETDGQFALPFSVPTEIRPSDGCYNGFNIFAVTVSEPEQSYYLNYTTEFDGADRQPHRVYETDYTVTIPITGQAKLDFYTVDGDHHQVTNNGTMTVPNVKTAQPYNGNFLEFTVLGVTRAN